MEIHHDKEYFEDMISELKDKKDNIDNIENKIDYINDILIKMDMPGASSILENAVDNLEQRIVWEYKEKLEDFIEVIKKGNEEMINTDDDIRNKIKG